MAPLLKEIERDVRAINLYPVAVKEDAKGAAMERLRKAYSRSGDSVRQHILFLIHESVAQVAEMKALQTYEYSRVKSPKSSPGAVRMSVYKSMFDYTSSIEGIVGLVRLLGGLKCGSEDDAAAKLLTHLFSHFCASESEINRMLRNAAIEALGESDSPYALNALLEYARFSDNERLFGRLASALADWNDKIGRLDIHPAEKQRLKEELREMQEALIHEEKPTQYG